MRRARIVKFPIVLSNQCVHPQLIPLKKDLDINSDRVARLADWAGDEYWVMRPSEDSWSASECVQHLNATSRAMVPLIREQLETSEKSAVTPGYGYDFFGWLVIRSVAPSTKTKFKTIARFVPEHVNGAKTDLVAWAVCQSDVIEALEQADGHPLKKLKIASPFNSRVRYNLFSAFRVIGIHQTRHLDQAERAIEAVRRG